MVEMGMGKKKVRLSNRFGQNRIADSAAGIDEKNGFTVGKGNKKRGCMTAEARKTVSRYRMRSAAAETGYFHYSCNRPGRPETSFEKSPYWRTGALSYGCTEK